MHTSPAWLVALTMMSIGFAGCTGGGGELDMVVTPADDPITQPYVFKAIGPKFDHYEWDFSDGSPIAEGREVEHIFGFSNGDIIVRLSAYNEGEEEFSIDILRTVSLGGSRNTNPIGTMTSTTYWVDPGEKFSINAFGSRDQEGDPLLYRWTCERLSDLIPPDTSHAPHEGLGGVPFGVDAWGETDENLTMEGTDYGEDLCTALDKSNNIPWSATATAIQGSIPETGGYAIELLVRDPKGVPWIGRVNMYVSLPDNLKPPATDGFNVTYTLNGAAGTQSNYEQPPAEGVPAPKDVAGNGSFDRVEQSFFVPIANKGGFIEFSHTAGEGIDVEYEILTDQRRVVFPASSDPLRNLTKDDFTQSADASPREYFLIITMEPAGNEVDVTFNMTRINDIDPINWYERL